MAPVVGRIRGRATFRALARPDGRARRGPVTVAFHVTEPPCWEGPAVAYSIGRRQGNAVRRNRVRRRLRAAVAASAAGLPAGSYLVRADAAAALVPFDVLRTALEAAARAAADAADRRASA